MYISGLLLRLLDLNETSDDTILELRGSQPYLSDEERVIVGNPKVVQSPVGYGIRCTTTDHVIFRYPVTDPMPCPFNIAECQEGFTLSLWFRWEKTAYTGYNEYIRIGGAFSMNRLPLKPRIDFSWYALMIKKYRWWNTITVPENEWVHVALIWNITHTVSYLNGEKSLEFPRRTTTISAAIGHEIRLVHVKPAIYSLSGLRFWSGRASPVFIWRLYQEGLLASTLNG